MTTINKIKLIEEKKVKKLASVNYLKNETSINYSSLLIIEYYSLFLTCTSMLITFFFQELPNEPLYFK